MIIVTFRLGEKILINEPYEYQLPKGSEVLAITSFEEDGNLLPALVLQYNKSDPVVWSTQTICTPYDTGEIPSGFDYKGSTTVRIDGSALRMHLLTKRLATEGHLHPDLLEAAASEITRSFREWEKLESVEVPPVDDSSHKSTAKAPAYPSMRIAGQ
jgi:hypothetical protein